MKYIYFFILVLALSACGKSADDQAREDYAKSGSKVDKYLKEMTVDGTPKKANSPSQ